MHIAYTMYIEHCMVYVETYPYKESQLFDGSLPDCDCHSEQCHIAESWRVPVLCSDRGEGGVVKLFVLSQ